MAWHAVDFPQNIPEGNVDAANGRSPDDSVPVPEMLAVHHLPEVLDPPRVLANQQLRQTLDGSHHRAGMPWAPRKAHVFRRPGRRSCRACSGTGVARQTASIFGSFSTCSQSEYRITPGSSFHSAGRPGSVSQIPASCTCLEAMVLAALIKVRPRCAPITTKRRGGIWVSITMGSYPEPPPEIVVFQAIRVGDFGKTACLRHWAGLISPGSGMPGRKWTNSQTRKGDGGNGIVRLRQQGSRMP